MECLVDYPDSYKSCLSAMLGASRQADGYVSLSPAGPSDRFMARVSDDAFGSSYFMDACPRGLKPSPLLHYLTPSCLSVGDSGRRWTWDDGKPASRALERAARGSSRFADCVSALSEALASDDEDQERFNAALGRLSFREEGGWHADCGDSLRYVDLWKAFRSEILLDDFRVLIAGDVVFTVGGKPTFFSEASVSARLDGLVLSISVSCYVKAEAGNVLVRFVSSPALAGGVPEPSGRLSEPEGWRNLF